MNAIKVPKQYKHELRNDAPIEYKRAEIRDYIKAHEGEVISHADVQRQRREILEGGKDETSSN